MLLPYVGFMWQEPTHCTQEIRQYENHRSNKYGEECTSLRRHGGMAEFPHFKYLPAELRLVIWQAAFANLNPAVAICTFAHDSCEITVNHPHSPHGRSPSIAHACKEARNEWFRSISTYERIHRALKYLFVPRTLFLVPSSAVIDSQLEYLMLPIEHVAINIADSPDLLPLFEALARLPSLQTIIIIIPSDTVEEQQAINWHETIRDDEKILKRISKLVDAPAPDGEWHHRTYMGWVLCNYLESPMARTYYAGDKRPKIKLFVDRSGSPSEPAVNTGQPWALYFY